MIIQQKLEEWIKHPELLNKDSLYELKMLLARYPYFQTTWILYLKNLFLTQDPSFKQELRRGALFVADLSVLFYYIEGERFLIKKHERAEQKEGEEGSTDRTLDLIDRFLADLSEPVPQELPLPESAAADYTSVLLQTDADSSSGQTAPLHGQDLIDHFIEQSEEMINKVPDEDEEEPVFAEMSEKEKEEEGEENYFTETLAKIYVKQQRYDKALEIIKKLNLKYPKKNTYFADQIRFLEKLIINAKSK